MCSLDGRHVPHRHILKVKRPFVGQLLYISCLKLYRRLLNILVKQRPSYNILSWLPTLKPSTVTSLFIDIIFLFINWSNKDACLLARLDLCLTTKDAHNYTVSQKMDPFSFEHNFGKCCPILIILSLLQT